MNGQLFPPSAGLPSLPFLQRTGALDLQAVTKLPARPSTPRKARGRKARKPPGRELGSRGPPASPLGPRAPSGWLGG